MIQRPVHFTLQKDEMMLIAVNRKQQIITTAQQLFAERGYEHATTQLIAKQAGVSEALIFKHHGSKEKLLDFVIKSGYKRIIQENRGMLQEVDPLQLIHTVIELPYKLVEDEPEFWKLQSRIIDTVPDARVQHERFMKPVYALIVKAFTDLGYPSPKKETRFLLLIVEMLWKQLSTANDEQAKGLRDFIKQKYNQQ